MWALWGYTVGAATAGELLRAIDVTVDRSLEMLGTVDEATLLEHRSVGRAGLPSTVIGLLFHAAEHAQRHTGQVITTSRIVRALGLRAGGPA